MLQLSRVILAFVLLIAPQGQVETLTPPQEAIPATFFGMHMHNAAGGTPWPSVEFGAWRLWDAHVKWPDLEPEKGQWTFATLDSYVALAEAHQVELLLPLGPSPTWASARPYEPSPAGPGKAAEPRSIEDWRDYVRAVGTRYKNRIHEYEIWNEPNDRHSYTGTVEAMITLVREAREILQQIDANNLVISPAATSFDGVRWLDQFLSKGGGEAVDAVGYHFYVNEYPPEKMIELIQQVESVMNRQNLRKPLWCTETGWYKPNPFPDELAPAYVARAYILSWAAGVSRFYWYAWDNHTWVTLEFTTANSKAPRPAALAYAATEKLLVSSRLQSCASDDSGTWVCALTHNGANSWIVWKETGEGKFAVPGSWHVKVAHSILSSQETSVANQELDIGPLPVVLH